METDNCTIMFKMAAMEDDNSSVFIFKGLQA